MGVELALIQEPELMAWDIFGTVLCAQSHVCEPVVAAISFVEILPILRGSCFVMISTCFELLNIFPLCWSSARALSVSLFGLMSGHLV